MHTEHTSLKCIYTATPMSIGVKRVQWILDRIDFPSHRHCAEMWTFERGFCSQNIGKKNAGIEIESISMSNRSVFTVIGVHYIFNDSFQECLVVPERKMWNLIRESRAQLGWVHRAALMWSGMSSTTVFKTDRNEFKYISDTFHLIHNNNNNTTRKRIHLNRLKMLRSKST